MLPIPPTHLLGGAGIHTLSVMVDARCQPVIVMVLYFTTKQVVLHPSELHAGTSVGQIDPSLDL
jgi:hypothetical protein